MNKTNTKPPPMAKEFEGMKEVKGPSLRIGVDVGGVLCSKSKEYESEVHEADSKGANDTNRLETGFDIPGCIEALEVLRFKGHKLFIVSFCGEKRAKETHRLFQSKYAHLFDDAYFVKKRKFKHDIAVHLGLDVMLEDRLDVLQSMSTVHRLHFIGDLQPDQLEKDAKDKKTQRYAAKPFTKPPEVVVLYTVKDWVEAVKTIDTLHPRGNKPDDSVAIKAICHCRYRN